MDYNTFINTYVINYVSQKMSKLNTNEVLPADLQTHYAKIGLSHAIDIWVNVMESVNRTNL